MQQSRRNTFTTLSTTGSLLPAELLARIAAADPSIDGLTPKSYHLAPSERLNEAATRAWNRLRSAWESFKAAMDTLPASDAGTTLTREHWLLILFQELGYGRLQTARAVEIDGKTYPISHLWHTVPIHLVSFRQELDRRTPGVRGASRASPHGLVQELLNRRDDYLWGFVSNGLRLRLLRDNASLTRIACIDFDLQAMMEGEVYSDFFLLFLLCHQSRVETPDGKTSSACWLERWYSTSLREGTRVLDRLRDGVTSAIQALGSGFLAHPANTALRDKLRTGTLSTQDYYRQVLRVVYRLLFLFVAEDRDLLLLPAGDDARLAAARDLYTRYYSTQRLRRLAERRRSARHADLYRALRLVFAKLHSGCPELALPALGSYLFAPTATADLNDADIANADLLEAVWKLTFTTDDNVRRAVDYRNLGPEELGSVYESLLEMHPDVHVDAGKFELRLAAGSERKTTGSYYTPTSLVNCLLDSALEPVLDEACKKPEPEKALLDLKVCDPACGSGHFLIAAARRIAKRLAAIRAGEDEPAPEAVQHALRDVVGRCIYGVDINPMAAELCKINLWIEALEPGKPLSFLDHHIRCGNSLLGTTPALIHRGIPDDAFTPLEGDDKKVCSALKKRNKQEHRGQGALAFAQPQWLKLGNLVQSFADLRNEDDSTPQALTAKEQHFVELLRSTPYENAWLIADAWCAAFVCEKRPNAPIEITEAIFRRWEDNPHHLTPAEKEELLRLRDQYKFFHWHLAFPEVFKPKPSDQIDESELTGWLGGFDCVLGNPPWGADIPKANISLLRYRYQGSQKGTIDTFALFIELFAIATRPQGMFGLVLPDILLLKNYPGIRLFLLDRTAMIELAHWGQAFDQVSIDVCSLVAQYTVPAANHRVRCIPEVTDGQPRASETNVISQSTFQTTKQYRFNLLLSPELQSHISAAKSLGPPMSELFVLREGVHSGNVRAKLFLDAPEGDHCERLLLGRDEISPMSLVWAGRYIQLDPDVFDRDAGEYFNLGDPDLHRSRKILVRRTGDHILAAVDQEGLFCSNNFFLCVPKPGVSWARALYACAVLNSRFSTWFFRAIQPRTGKLFAELKITHLEDIPIPFANEPWADTIGSSIEAWFATPASIAELLARFDNELVTRIAAASGELGEILRGAQ